MKLRTIFLAVCATAGVSLVVEQASAFAPPISPIAGLVIAAGAAAPFLGSAAAGATVAAGLTPVGWAALGVGVIATVLISSDTSSGTPSKLIVSTLDSSTDPNPDYVVSRPGFHHSYYWGWGATNPNAAQVNGVQTYMQLPAYFTTDYAAWTLPANANGADLALRMDELISCNGNGCNSSATPAQYSQQFADWQQRGRPGLVRSAVGTDVQIGNYVVARATRGGYYATLSRVVDINCAGGFDFDSSLLACVSHPTVIDGQCNVSWDSGTGCPVVNSFDPDCSSFKLQTSCGDATSPASIVGTDSTGRSLAVQRSTKTYTLPGGDAVAIVDSVPNTGSNTTTKTSITLRPATPGAVPTATGSSTSTLPGTGSSVGTNPVQQVTVTNWPTSLTTPQTTGTGSAPSVTFPDSMKINPEGHSESEVPDAAAASESVASDVKSMFDPLKQKLAPFSTLTIPSHASECPAVDIRWHAYTNIDVHSTAICDLLETPSIKNIIQGVLMLLITLAAIRILLGA